MKTEAPQTPTIATVGTFDGVHTGHVHLLEQLRDKARELGLSSWVLTFPAKPCPQAQNSGTSMLNSADEKLALLRQYADYASIISLCRDDFKLTGREFLSALKERYGVEAFMMGFNNHIGSDRACAADLTDAAIPVFEASAKPGGICSTAARHALAEGRPDNAADILGRPYSLCGKVTAGKQLGRTIGFPTANIEPDDSRRAIPATGVYAVDVAIDDDRRTYRGVANIGHRPTVDTDGAPMSIEVHILGFDGDIYGRTLTVAFRRRLRAEQRFGSLDELRAAIEADCRLAAEI